MSPVLSARGPTYHVWDMQGMTRPKLRTPEVSAAIPGGSLAAQFQASWSYVSYRPRRKTRCSARSTATIAADQYAMMAMKFSRFTKKSTAALILIGMTLGAVLALIRKRAVTVYGKKQL